MDMDSDTGIMVIITVLQFLIMENLILIMIHILRVTTPNLLSLLPNLMVPKLELLVKLKLFNQTSSTQMKVVAHVSQLKSVLPSTL